MAVPLLVLLASCGSSDSPPAAAPAANAVASTAAPSPSKAADADAVAARLKAAIGAITKTVTITEDNDPNNSIGRPGKYRQAVSIYDSRVKCQSPLDITCGAKVEVFADREEAQARADYLKGVTEANPILGSEYDYVSGAVLLRVWGDLKPSQAKEYEAAFGG